MDREIITRVYLRRASELLFKDEKEFSTIEADQ